jgi:AcrR family transcriptional regulator
MSLVMTSSNVAVIVSTVKSANAEGPRPSRRERAARTRAAIIRSAQNMFVERGYAGATMSEIAQAAGVAVQTVYFVFHTKSDLLRACYEAAVFGEDAVPPPQQAWYQQTLAADTAHDALRAFATGTASIQQRVAAFDEIVRGAVHEPEAVAVRAQTEGFRRFGFREIAQHLHDRFGLRRSVDEATDLLMLLGGPSVYRTLVIDYGWPQEIFTDWLTETCVQQLIKSLR